MNIPKYNSNLKPFARQLRSNMTLAEVLLWKKLNRRQLGVQFSRQKPAGKWVIDFYCKELQLAIEVDGSSHNFKKAQDDERQRQLESLGIRFLRVWDCEVKNDIGAVVERIKAWIRDNPPRPPATPPVEGIIKIPTPASGHPSCGGDHKFPKTTRGTIPSAGGVPERRGGYRSGAADQSAISNRQSEIINQKSGSALVVVMWVLVIVAMIVSSFAFEMQLEARIISAQRKRFKADQLALAGVEMAKAMLAFVPETGADKDTVYEDPYLNAAANIAEALPIDYREAFGDGEVTVKIDYEEGRLNIRTLSDDGWKMLFEQAGIPNTRWDTLLGCLTDWQDEGDTHQLNGAESDDPFYKKRGYECKNAPVDTVNELLLIKNWGEEVLYGTPPGEETDDPVAGIANRLTTWGSGKINPNSASPEVLNSLPISDGVIDAILEMRLGPDREAGTEDDGLDEADLGALGIPDLFTLSPEYAAVTAIGTVGNVRSEISCIFRLGEKEAVPLFWLEGKTSR
jgi:very-short-patch-repair endonuclease